VVLVGHSAGGHLALWAAREHPVALAVSLAGVCDLEAAADAGLGDSAVLEFLGADPDTDLYAAASPIARVPLARPALLIHGDADAIVPVQQSRVYRDAAVTAGDDCELRELPGGDHFEPVDPAGRALPILQQRLQTLSAG
ncbi:MAG: prolyl oligopeptidase family serine peptidase, partial [Solirubrobacteraceae bacterium]